MRNMRALLVVSIFFILSSTVTAATEQHRTAHASDISAQTAQLNRDLFTAVSDGSIEKAKRLLTAGADINARQPPWNLTPLLVAPDVSVDMVRFLVSRGAKINVADKEGTTVLIKAVRANAVASVDFLLGKGADVDTVDGHGNTALVHAVLQSNPDIVQRLIKHGADVNVVTDSGATPLAIVKREREAAEDMKPDLNEAMPSMHHEASHGAHPMRTKAQAMAQTKAVAELLSKAGATRDQQPLQRSEAERHAAHNTHTHHETSTVPEITPSVLHEAQAKPTR